MDLTRRNTVILMKFSKQIANIFVKIINGYKDKFKTLKSISDGDFSAKSSLASEANLKSCQASKMELFANIVTNLKLFTLSAKTSILVIWLGSQYAFELAYKFKDVSFLNQLEYLREQVTFYYSLRARDGFVQPIFYKRFDCFSF